jgi:hypothetical protein
MDNGSATIDQRARSRDRKQHAQLCTWAPHLAISRADERSEMHATGSEERWNAKRESAS